MTLKPVFISNFMHSLTSPLPLAVFRLCFGLLMLVSTIRFWLNGWIDLLYLKPTFFFTYYGFEWVRPLPYPTIYYLFLTVGISAFFVAIGFFYRFSIILFFLSFTYIELIDKTNYLNHYYLVSLLSFLLIFSPANACFSLDNWLKIAPKRDKISNFYLFTIKFQLVLVYFFAGVAKINPDWLLEALPMRIWLPPKTDIPLIGKLLAYPFTAYFFAWAGMLFDVSIGFLLWWRKTSIFAYCLVIVFHLLTALLFPQIGMFPFMMIFLDLIFLQLSVTSYQLPITNKQLARNNYQLKIHKEQQTGNKQQQLAINNKQSTVNNQQQLTMNNKQLTTNNKQLRTNKEQLTRNKKQQTTKKELLIVFFTIQLLLPFRYLLYPNHLFWTEEGYRFSWRVMLMEKAGTIFFTVKKPETEQIIQIRNQDYLTPLQEKMMCTQPDMILQFAHFLAKTHTYHPSEKIQVFANAYVSVNGKGHRKFIDENVDLTKENEGFMPKKWILPYNKLD